MTIQEKIALVHFSVETSRDLRRPVDSRLLDSGRGLQIRESALGSEGSQGRCTALTDSLLAANSLLCSGRSSTFSWTSATYSGIVMTWPVLLISGAQC